MMKNRAHLLALVGALVLAASCCGAQDYYEDNYGNQDRNGNQGDGDSYGNGNQGDDGYSGSAPNYQQNVDSDGTNNSPSSYSPQGGSDAEGDYEGDDGSAAAAASNLEPSVVRVRRSVEPQAEGDTLKAAQSAPKLRVKRHGKYYIGPVYTYVKTDKHANFKWGVKHKVGKKHHR